MTARSSDGKAPPEQDAEAGWFGELNMDAVNVQMRWMIRRDMPEVLAIEAESFEFPWPEEDFIRCLRGRNFIGMVAEYDDRIVGFMIYELTKKRIEVLNLAVAVRVLFVRRTVGEPDREIGNHSGPQVQARMDRFGQDAKAAGHQAHNELEDGEEHGRQHRTEGRQPFLLLGFGIDVESHVVVCLLIARWRRWRVVVCP